MLVFLLVLAVALGVGYVALRPTLTGPDTQRAPAASASLGPVLFGEGEHQFMTGPDGAPFTATCNPQTVANDKRCGDLKVVVIDAELMPWIARNISLAWAEGYPAILHKGEEAGYQTRRTQACGTRYASTYISGSCDEFPFTSSLEGGTDASGRKARTEEVHISEQNCQGGTIRQAYARHNVQNGDEYIVIISHPENIATQPWAGQPREATTC